MSEQDVAPDMDDVLQEEALPAEAVPVRVEGPVRAQLPGSRVGTSRQITLTTTIETIAGADPRRRRLVVLPTTSDIRIGTREDCDNNAAFVLPDPIPLEITHTDAVYARAVTGTAITSILTEQWAE